VTAVARAVSTGKCSGGAAAERSTGTAPWWLSAKQIWQASSAGAGISWSVTAASATTAEADREERGCA